jgi:hypothetical protein
MSRGDTLKRRKCLEFRIYAERLGNQDVPRNGL